MPRIRPTARAMMGLPRKVVVDALPLCDYIPKAFTSLSRNKQGLIAASRLDGSIDIYDEKDHFYLIHHIPPWVLTSVYSICWSKSRLFATGGEGHVFELDTTSIHPKACMHSYLIRLGISYFTWRIAISLSCILWRITCIRQRWWAHKHRYFEQWILRAQNIVCQN